MDLKFCNNSDLAYPIIRFSNFWLILTSVPIWNIVIDFPGSLILTLNVKTKVGEISLF